MGIVGGAGGGKMGSARPDHQVGTNVQIVVGRPGHEGRDVIVLAGNLRFERIIATHRVEHIRRDLLPVGHICAVSA